MKESNEDGSKSLIQKPFRCSREFEARLNRIKGALMMQTGERISDNQFLLDLVKIGMDHMSKKLDLS